MPYDTTGRTNRRITRLFFDCWLPHPHINVEGIDFNSRRAAHPRNGWACATAKPKPRHPRTADQSAYGGGVISETTPTVGGHDWQATERRHQYPAFPLVNRGRRKPGVSSRPAEGRSRTVEWIDHASSSSRHAITAGAAGTQHPALTGVPPQPQSNDPNAGDDLAGRGRES